MALILLISGLAVTAGICTTRQVDLIAGAIAFGVHGIAGLPYLATEHLLPRPSAWRRTLIIGFALSIVPMIRGYLIGRGDGVFALTLWGGFFQATGGFVCLAAGLLLRFRSRNAPATVPDEATPADRMEPISAHDPGVKGTNFALVAAIVALTVTAILRIVWPVDGLQPFNSRVSLLLIPICFFHTGAAALFVLAARALPEVLNWQRRVLVIYLIVAVPLLVIYFLKSGPGEGLTHLAGASILGAVGLILFLIGRLSSWRRDAHGGRELRSIGGE